MDPYLNRIVKPEWFGGDPAGVEMVLLLANMTHAWDDLIDKDKDVTNNGINDMMRIALVELPKNRIYQRIQGVAPAIWSTVITAYEASTKYENESDIKGIEIGHVLRYLAGQLVSLAIETSVSKDDARKFIPEMWKVIVYERFDDYRKEHLNV